MMGSGMIDVAWRLATAGVVYILYVESGIWLGGMVAAVSDTTFSQMSEDTMRTTYTVEPTRSRAREQRSKRRGRVPARLARARSPEVEYGTTRLVWPKRPVPGS